MQIFTEVEQVQIWSKTMKTHGKSIGFVPTMGALHLGHMSLIEQASAHNDFVICSIFVNPTQFNNPVDLKKYPRTEEEDIELLEKNGCDVVFIPTANEMYPGGLQTNKFNYNGLEAEMEGKFRQGHFDGVGTVVNRFFEIIQPTRAYFGEKDYQQLRIIQQLVINQNHSTGIIPVTIKREADGLAMSSRNRRLTAEFRQESPIIFQTLQKVIQWKSEFSVEEINKKVVDIFANSNLELEYFILADEDSLKPIQNWNESQKTRAFIAAFAGEIRLIDNQKIT